MQEVQETWVQSLGWEDPLEEGMATHSSILTWRIPWTEELGGLQSIGLQRVGQDWSDLARMHAHSRTKSLQSLFKAEVIVLIIQKHFTIYNGMLLLLLLLLSHFGCVRLCATPETAAHQAPPSLGFSGQEHWSGLPFPSPMHESEKWSRSVVSDS